MTQAVRAALAKATAATTAPAPATSSGNGVTISAAARLAAATAADKSKDFNALATEVRNALDDKSADLTEMSGRALAAIMLDRNGQFTRTEIAAAKSELTGRTREDFTVLATGSSALGGLGAYNQQLVSQYDAMSDEEREARGWTPALRNSAAAFIQGSQTASSLFDAIDQVDSDDPDSAMSINW